MVKNLGLIDCDVIEILIISYICKNLGLTVSFIKNLGVWFVKIMKEGKR